MLRTPRILAGRRPSAPLVISTAALVIALGGTSYAAATIGNADIKNGAVSSLKIKDGTIERADLASSARIAGPRGPQGPAGTDGTDGEDGTNGTNGTNGTDGEDGAPGPAGVGRWLLVDRDGSIVAQSGGFAIRTAYDQVNNSGAAVPAGAVGNVYIDANEDLSNNGITVSIALQNQFNQDQTAGNAGRNAGPDANPEFSGEITSTVCAIPSVVVCAPNGANTRNTFVVSPRNSDGSFTQTGAVPADPANPNTHKRFYVIISGDSSDYVAPTPAIPAVPLPPVAP